MGSLAMAKSEQSDVRQRRGKSADLRSDQDLVQAIAGSRDRDAFTELFSRHQQAAFNLACYITGSRTLGEEAVQEAMLRLWTSAKTFMPMGNARTWLLRIVVREALRSIKSQRRHARRAEVDLDAQVADGEGAGSMAVDRELRVALRGQLEHLEPVQRTMLALYYSAGLSQEEIAVTFGVTQQTVSNRINETLATLRRGLAQAGYAAGVPLLGDGAVGAALFPVHTVPAGFADRLFEKVGVVAGHSQRAAAAQGASMWLWAASVVAVAAGCGGVWWVTQPAELGPSAAKKEAHSSAPTGTKTPSITAEEADEAPRTITWDFTKGPPKDFTILVGRWTWKMTPKGGVVEVPEQTFIVLPWRARPRPMVVEISMSFMNLRKNRGLSYGCSWIKNLPDCYVQLAREVLDNVPTIQADRDLSVDHYIFGKTVVSILDGQPGCYSLYSERYPGDHLMISCENARLTRICLRELDEHEIPESYSDPNKLFSKLKASFKTIPDRVTMKALIAP